MPDAEYRLMPSSWQILELASNSVGKRLSHQQIPRALRAYLFLGWVCKHRQWCCWVKPMDTAGLGFGYQWMRRTLREVSSIILPFQFKEGFRWLGFSLIGPVLYYSKEHNIRDGFEETRIALSKLLPVILGTLGSHISTSITPPAPCLKPIRRRVRARRVIQTFSAGWYNKTKSLSWGARKVFTLSLLFILGWLTFPTS